MNVQQLFEGTSTIWILTDVTDEDLSEYYATAAGACAALMKMAKSSIKDAAPEEQEKFKKMLPQLQAMTDPKKLSTALDNIPAWDHGVEVKTAKLKP